MMMRLPVAPLLNHVACMTSSCLEHWEAPKTVEQRTIRREGCGSPPGEGRDANSAVTIF